MSTIIKSDSAQYWTDRKLFNLKSPVAPSGVWFLERDGLNLGRRNLADVDLNPAALVGSPVPGAGFTTCGNGVPASPSKGFQTDISETATMTMLMIARSRDTMSDSATRPMLINNYFNSDPGADGFGIGFQSATQTYLFASYTGGADNNYLVNGQANASWQALAVVVEDGVGMKLFNLTNASTGTYNNPAARVTAARKMRIGCGFSGFAGQVDMAFAAIIPSAMTLDQCDDALEQPRLYLSEQLGIAT